MHFSWVILVFYLIYDLDKERQERIWYRRFQEYQKQKKEEERRIKAFEVKERIEFFNTLFEKLWPKMGPFM